VESATKVTVPIALLAAVGASGSAARDDDRVDADRLRDRVHPGLKPAFDGSVWATCFPAAIFSSSWLRLSWRTRIGGLPLLARHDVDHSAFGFADVLV